MTKLTQENKRQIIDLIKQKVRQLKTDAAVATFCDVSPAVISMMKKDKYVTQGETAWLKVGTALGWRPNTKTGGREWITADTRDVKIVQQVVADAKNNSLFLAIADIGGSGKSEGLRYAYQANAHQEVYYLRCMDWGKTEFLENLCKTLGMQVTGIRKPNKMLEMVIEFFQQRSLNKPLLMLDEYNKLKDSARLTVIPLYNECEDYLGMVIAGPEDLEKSILTGVRYQKRGYDELYSRLGRTFVKLVGATLNDVINICKLNGFENADRIKEKFENHKPVRKIIRIGSQDTHVRVIRDLRWVKILVKVNRNKLAS
jgi:hypothetical protein